VCSLSAQQGWPRSSASQIAETILKPIEAPAWLGSVLPAWLRPQLALN
jgi:hypothetical protein